MQLTADIVAGFSGSLLQSGYDNAVESPECHYEWWTYCTSKHSKVAIAAPRRHAKSTAVSLAYVLASVLFRDRSYCIIISDTITQATQFLGDVKRQLVDNEQLRALFKIKDFKEKDTEDDVIVTCEDGHQFRISAKGSEQKMRGLKWNNKRPDLIVCDDLENDEIVMNKDRRDKFKRWFYGAVIPCLSATGVIRIVGTILHEDSFLNNLMPSEWDKRTVVEDLKIWRKALRTGEWLSVKYKAHNEDFTKILWPTHYDKDYFVSLRQDYVDRGMPDVYSQEILNTPIDESVAYFKRGDFTTETQDEKKTRLNYYISADLAISEKETADYSVFVVGGVDENKILHIRNVIRERLDGREIVDMIIGLHKAYEPELIGIEDMQITKSIGPFLREEMIRQGVFPNVIGLKHNGQDKIARARSIQARMRARTIKFDKSQDWYPTFEDELCKFPRSAKDDQVDAFAYLGRMLDSLIEAPTQREVDEEEYQDQLRESQINNDGRSTFTGY
jgi:predicted phage terminase large subunit-like protein